MSPFTAGMRLHDRFVLIDLIGIGGMSQVWRATDEVLDRPVAVKVLVAELAGEPALREATWREARAAAWLTHPNITRVYDYGEAPLPGGGHAPYLVMELVQGENLADRLAAGPLPWPQAARIGAYVAAALAAAHELGVVHHDIKPGNVMLTAERAGEAGGGAKVLDFGTAALIGAIDQEALAGTPSYAAPERLEWGPAQSASDVYSLGVLLYDALAGDPPAALDSWDEAAAAHRAGRAARTVALPDLPPEAAELLQACLSPDPERRPPARQVATTLAELAGIPDPSANVSAEPPTLVAPPHAVKGTATAPTPRTRVDHRAPPAPTRGSPRLLIAGLGVAAVVLGLILALAVVQRPSETPDPEGAAPATPSSEPATSAPAAPPAEARDALADLDQAIREAHSQGALDSGVARRLRDRVRDMAKELQRPNEDPDRQAEKVREKADELGRELERLQERGEVPEQLAGELRTLLVAVTKSD